MTDPTALDLHALFRDPDMFESRRAWAHAGFQVNDRSNNGKIMVASHPSVPGLLFKKYTNDVSQKDQTRNYERRIEGADRLRAFVDSRRLRLLVVPHKWLLELPRPFSRKETSHVLVVERLDLMSEDQTKATYYRIDPSLLAELSVVLHRFRGMDSNAKNVPFVADGRIAFVDTEHWDRSTSKSYLYHLGEYLSKERQKLAKKIFGQLDDGDDVTVGVASDFDDEEDTSDSSDSSDDFAHEEDTSSLSSS